jgi:hypothetical protein
MVLFRPPNFRILFFLLTLFGCLAGLLTGNYIAVLLFSSMAGSFVLFPDRNPMLYWPFGLALSIVCLYGAYAAMWLFDVRGVTTHRANLIFLGLMVLFAALWVVRSAITRPTWRREIHPATFALIVSLVASLVIFAVHRSLVHPEFLIGDHLAGGDHGIHIQYINGLVNGSDVGYSSPFSLQDYPKGIHFVVALLFAIHEPISPYTRIVDVHIVAAVFEYIQLAAFLQLLLVATLTQIRKRILIQIGFTISLLILFLSLPKSINHLFWSGFTTSLALTWFLLLPVAMPWSAVSLGKEGNKAKRLYFWIVFSVLAWIVYQPYVIVTLSILTVEFLWSFKRLFFETSAVKNEKKRMFKIGLVAPAIAFLSPVLMLLVLGQDSESIKRLTLFGVSWKVDQILLLMTVTITLLLIGKCVRCLSLNSQVMSDGVLYLAIVAFTASFAIVAARTSAFTMTNQPYYVQKMYWIVFFVGFTISAKWLLTSALSVSLSGRKWLNGILGSLLPLAILFPLYVSRNSPSEALDRISINWFAKSLMVDVSDIEPYNAAAFHTWENLGAHVGNIALKEVTDTYLAVDVAQSRNPYWACWTMRKSNVNVVHTATGQGTSLLDAGCSQFITYIEDDTRFDRLIPKTAEMVINKEIPLQRGTKGKRFLISGFSKRNDSGAVADGFHSTVQMVSVRNLDNASAVFSIGEYGRKDRQISVEFLIDGVLVNTYPLQKNSKIAVLSLPTITKGSMVSFQFVCAREESEVIEVLAKPELLECLTLRDFKINVPD